MIANCSASIHHLRAAIPIFPAIKLKVQIRIVQMSTSPNEERKISPTDRKRLESEWQAERIENSRPDPNKEFLLDAVTIDKDLNLAKKLKADRLHFTIETSVTSQNTKVKQTEGRNTEHKTRKVVDASRCGTNDAFLQFVGVQKGFHGVRFVFVIKCKVYERPSKACR